MTRIANIARKYANDELVLAMLFVGGGLGSAIAVVSIFG
jgi:hypothetical protein